MASQNDLRTALGVGIATDIALDKTGSIYVNAIKTNATKLRLDKQVTALTKKAVKAQAKAAEKGTSEAIEASAKAAEKLSKASSKLADASTDAAKASLAVSKATGASAKIGKIAGALGYAGFAVDIAVGSTLIAGAAKTGNTGKIVKESVAMTANVGASAGAAAAAAAGIASTAFLGPVAILAIVQILGAVLDMFWNPFKFMYNDDIKTIKTEFDKSLKKLFMEDGYNYPLEVKPAVIPDPEINKEEADYVEYIYQKYLDDRGLITEEDALKEETLINDLRSLRRMNSYFKVNPDGTYDLSNPVFTAVDYSNEQELGAIMKLAEVIIKKKRKANLEKILKETKAKKKSQFQLFLEKDYQLILLAILVIIIISVNIIFW